MQVCGHEFTQFYPTFMTSLRQLLGSGDPERCQEEQQILKNMLHEHIGRCLIEAAVAFASDLFPAVGLETFKPVRGRHEAHLAFGLCRNPEYLFLKIETA